MPKKGRRQRKGRGGQKGGGSRSRPPAKARARTDDRQAQNQQAVDVGPEAASTAAGSRKEGPRVGGPSGAKVAGLCNLGNTCFLNSALQVLKACPSLQRYYATCGEATRDKPLTCVLGDWFRFGGDGKKGGGTYKPSNLVQEIRRLAPHFKGRQQHDSHELLRYVLDMLRNEGKSLDGEGKGQKMENGTERVEQENLVGCIFGGTFASSISCMHCGHKSEQNEEFLDLSVPVVQDACSTGGGMLSPSQEEKENRHSRCWMTAKERQRLKKELYKKERMQQKEKGECMDMALQNGGNCSNAAAPPLLDSESAINNNLSAEHQPSSSGADGVQSCHGDLSTAASTAGEPDANSSSSAASMGKAECKANVSSKAATLERCLEKFFEEEQVFWECPREAEERQKHTSSKRVRFSESEPVVFEVPASDGCRGCDFLNGMTLHELMSKANDNDSSDESSEGVEDEEGEDAIEDGARETKEKVGDGDEEGEKKVEDRLEAKEECTQEGAKENGEEAELVEEKGEQDTEVGTAGETDEKEGEGIICSDCESVGSVEICSSSEEDTLQSESSGSCSPEQTYTWSKVWTSSLRSCLRKQVEMKEAHKKYSIQTAPRVLTIHLKRFDRNQYGKLVKVKTHVRFGMEIEMGPFCEPSGGSFRYQLFGLIEHRGGMRGGHYVAYVKRTFPEDDDGSLAQDRWFFVSDQVVREVDEREVAAREAYLLLYERV